MYVRWVPSTVYAMYGAENLFAMYVRCPVPYTPCMYGAQDHMPCMYGAQYRIRHVCTVPSTVHVMHVRYPVVNGVALRSASLIHDLGHTVSLYTECYYYY